MSLLDDIKAAAKDLQDYANGIVARIDDAIASHAATPVAPAVETPAEAPETPAEEASEHPTLPG